VPEQRLCDKVLSRIRTGGLTGHRCGRGGESYVNGATRSVASLRPPDPRRSREGPRVARSRTHCGQRSGDPDPEQCIPRIRRTSIGLKRIHRPDQDRASASPRRHVVCTRAHRGEMVPDARAVERSGRVVAHLIHPGRPAARGQISLATERAAARIWARRSAPGELSSAANARPAPRIASGAILTATFGPFSGRVIVSCR
jgi:hypothetical protein